MKKSVGACGVNDFEIEFLVKRLKPVIVKNYIKTKNKRTGTVLDTRARSIT